MDGYPIDLNPEVKEVRSPRDVVIWFLFYAIFIVADTRVELESCRKDWKQPYGQGTWPT